MKYDVEASHILIKLDPNATGEDTVEVYQKMERIRKRAIEGEDFNKLASEVSEDGSVKYNKGELGYFTVFGMVYPFETVAYNTEVGDISDIFRTRFGYHIIKLTDKRPAKGKVKVAHIMILKPRKGTAEEVNAAKKKADSIYNAIVDDGAEFKEMAREYSEDRRSGKSGGVLPWFGVGGKMIPKFENAAFELENLGDMSEVIETGYGWHIIKLLDKEDIPNEEDAIPTLKSRVSNSARASRSKQVLVSRLKKEYDFTLYDKNFDVFHQLVDDSIFYGTWDPKPALELDKPIIEFADTVLTQHDFAKYMSKYNRKQDPQDIKIFVNERFKNFCDKMVLLYEERHLHDKFPKFRYLMKEYHDGILLFNITDKMVWTKAVEDSAGLEKFYEKNKNDYMWDTRYKSLIVQAKDKKITKKLYKYMKKQENLCWDSLFKEFTEKDSAAVTKVVRGKFEKGDKPLIDKIVAGNKKLKKVGDVYISKNKENNQVTYIEQLAPEVKKLDEARGLVTADYQNKLEKEWLEKLHNKYEIQVHDDVLKSLIKE